MAHGERNGSIREQLARHKAADILEVGLSEVKGFPLNLEGEHLKEGISLTRGRLDAEGGRMKLGVLRSIDVIAGLSGDKGLLSLVGEEGARRGDIEKNLTSSRDAVEKAFDEYLKKKDDESFETLKTAIAYLNNELSEEYRRIVNGDNSREISDKEATDKKESKKETHDEYVGRKKRIIIEELSKKDVSEDARERLLAIIDTAENDPNQGERDLSDLLDTYVRKLRNSEEREILLLNAVYQYDPDAKEERGEGKPVKKEGEEKAKKSTSEKGREREKKSIEVKKSAGAEGLEAYDAFEKELWKELSKEDIDPVDIHTKLRFGLEYHSGLAKKAGEEGDIGKHIKESGVPKKDLISYAEVRKSYTQLKNALGSYLRRIHAASTSEEKVKIQESLKTQLSKHRELLANLLKEIDKKKSVVEVAETTQEEVKNTPVSPQGKVNRKGPFENTQNSKKVSNEVYSDDYDESFIDEAIVTVDGYETPKSKETKDSGKTEEEKMENSAEGQEEYSLKEIFDDVEQKRARLAELTENLNPVHVGTSESRRVISESISFILAYQDTPESEISEEIKKEIQEKYRGIIDAYEAVTFDLAQGESVEEKGQGIENSIAELNQEQREARRKYYEALKEDKKSFQVIRGLRALSGEGMSGELKSLKDDFENKYRAYLQERARVYAEEDRGELKRREINIDRRIEREAQMLLNAQIEREPGRLGKMMQKVGNTLNKIPKSVRTTGRYVIAGGIGAATGGITGAGLTIGRMLFGTAVGTAVGVGVDRYMQRGVRKKEENLSAEKTKQQETIKEGRITLENIQEAIETRRKAQGEVHTSESRKKAVATTAALLAGFIAGRSGYDILEGINNPNSGVNVVAGDMASPGSASQESVSPSDVQEEKTGDANGLPPSDTTPPYQGVDSAIQGLPDSDTTPPYQGVESTSQSLPPSDTTPPYQGVPNSGIDAIGDNNVPPEFQSSPEVNNVPTETERNQSQSFEGDFVPDDEAVSFEGDGAEYIDPITVEKGDTLWNHMEESFKDKFSDLSPSERDVVLDKIVDHLEQNPELGNQIGVGEDPHLIHPGDVLNLNPLNELVDQYISEVKGGEVTSNEALPEPPAREEVPPEPPSREDIPPEPPVRPEGEGEMITFEEEAYRGTPERGEGPYETRESSLPLHEYRDRGINATFDEVFPSENGFLGIGGSDSGVDSPTWNQMKEVSAESFLGPQATLDNINVGTADQKEFISNLVGELAERTGEQPEANESVIDFLGRTIDPAIRNGYRFPNMGIGAVA